MKTYLQVINEVLRELRETEVTVLTANYTKLIGQFVNQAREVVEDAHEWSSLYVDLTFSTVLDQQNYDLSAVGTTPVITTSSTGRFANDRSRIAYDVAMRPLVYDITSSTAPVRLAELSRTQQYDAGIMAGQNLSRLAPTMFSFHRPNGVETLTLLNPPPASKAMKVRLWIPQTDLTATGDTVLVPWRPVALLATAFALDERGEELGIDGNKVVAQAKGALQQAIERDQSSAAPRTYFAD